jgi:hypothetical protein
MEALTSELERAKAEKEEELRAVQSAWQEEQDRLHARMEQLQRQAVSEEEKRAAKQERERMQQQVDALRVQQEAHRQRLERERRQQEEQLQESIRRNEEVRVARGGGGRLPPRWARSCAPTRRARVLARAFDLSLSAVGGGGRRARRGAQVIRQQQQEIEEARRQQALAEERARARRPPPGALPSSRGSDQRAVRLA